jgi:hypothetical protein
MMRRMIIGWSCGALALLLASKATAENRPVEPPGLSIRNGQLVLAGRPYRGVGANYFDLFLRILHEPTNSASLRGLEQLSEAGIPFVRLATAFNASDYRIYLENREAYFQRLDQVVKAAERCKVGLIPSLLWNLDLPDAVGEHRDQWENPKSKTIGTMRQYVGDIVSRYKDSPAIWAWEFGNEPNLSVDLPNAIQFRRQGGTERDDLKSQYMVAAMTEFASAVRRQDTWRPIFSGNSQPRPSAWHNTHEGNWKPDSPEQARLMVLRDNPACLGTISVHCYEGRDSQGKPTAWTTNRLEWLQWLKGIAREAQRPLWVGEFGLRSGANSDIRADFEQMLAHLEEAKVDLAAFWVFDLASQENTWSVTPANDRAFMLRVVADANRQWNRALAGQTHGIPDNRDTAPRGPRANINSTTSKP